jgi:hypothetical protein
MDDELGIGEGRIDDAETMLTFAKRNEWWVGTPKKGYDLEFGDFQMHFDSIPRAVKYLYDEPDIYGALRASLIATHAQSLGMPDTFVNYLLGITE